MAPSIRPYPIRMNQRQSIIESAILNRRRRRRRGRRRGEEGEDSGLILRSLTAVSTIIVGGFQWNVSGCRS